ELFARLKELHEEMEAALAEGERTRMAAVRDELGKLFLTFKFTPKVIDTMVENLRKAVERIRSYEREVMRTAVKKAEMPRKTFLETFPGRESDYGWLEEQIKSGAPYAQKL